MGLNAYFTYQVVGYHGTGPVSYRLALTAVFIEGFIFLFLSLIGLRQWLVRIIPASIKVASGVGIGLFLTETGMSSSGIGLISGSPDTPTDLAGCPAQYINQASGQCTGHRMSNPQVCVQHPKTKAHINKSTDVDWNNVQWGLNSISHGIPCQICHYYWHIPRVYIILAVSSYLQGPSSYSDIFQSRYLLHLLPLHP